MQGLIYAFSHYFKNRRGINIKNIGHFAGLEGAV
jgi:hypothetical protein